MRINDRSRLLVGPLAIVLAVSMLLGCGGSQTGRASTEILENHSVLGSVFVEIQGPMPIVRLLGKSMRQTFSGPVRLAVAAATHGRRHCSYVQHIGNAASFGLSRYAGEQAFISVYGTGKLAKPVCEDFGTRYH
jgi:hypothetical protein